MRPLLILLIGLAPGMLVNAQNSRHSFLENLVYGGLEVLSERFCAKRIEKHHTLSEKEKQAVFLTRPKAGVAILFSEFIFGHGPEWRYFHQGMQHTQRFMQSTGWSEVCKAWTQREGGECDSIWQYRYQFSARVVPFQPASWYFAVQQNIKSLKRGDLEQFFLGSFDVYARRISETNWRFEVYNRTSRRSLYAGFLKRVERPKRLGTIRQVFVFELSESDIQLFISGSNEPSNHS